MPSSGVLYVKITNNSPTTISRITAIPGDLSHKDTVEFNIFLVS